jgi:hypothetical protein
MSNNSDAQSISSFLKDKINQHNDAGTNSLHHDAVLSLNSQSTNDLVFNSASQKGHLNSLYAAFMPSGQFPDFLLPNGDVKPEHNGGDKAGAAQAAAARVIADAESGTPNDGAAAGLNGHYAGLSNFNGEEFAAKGAIEAAMGIHSARSAVRDLAAKGGDNTAAAAAGFKSVEDYQAYLKLKQGETTT